MPIWDDVTGQDRVIARLRAAIAGDRVHHAYLFTGPAGSGKRRTSLALASALNCLERPGHGCGACEACSKIDAGIHPDIVTLEREGAAQLIPIETIRSQVVSRVGLPPHEARVRVFVIDEATAMVPASANALLKTLEEPPARTMFVLSTRAPDQLLPTIRSRCQRVVFNGVAGAELVRDDPERAARIAALADEVAEHAGDGAGIALALRIAEGKGDAPLVMQAAAIRLGRDARAALERGDRDAAVRCSARAQRIMAWHVALTIHNANPPLAMEAVLAELARSAP